MTQTDHFLSHATGARPQGCAPVASAAAESATLFIPPLRLVLDTNVLLSLWVFDLFPAGSRFAPLRECIESGRFLALSRADCLDEFAEVLGYPEFRLSSEQQRRVFARYSAVAVSVPMDVPQDEIQLPRCKDRDDQKFLELASAADADVLVTSDKALLKLARHRALAGRFRIETPERFIARLVFGNP